jgi:hypothetical protein
LNQFCGYEPVNKMAQKDMNERTPPQREMKKRRKQ